MRIEDATPLPLETAMNRAVDICLANGIKVSKSHLTRLLRMKNADKTALRFFYSVSVRTGKGNGLMVVDMGNFEELLLAALDAFPQKGRGNVPRVTEENLNAPAG